MFDCLPPAGFIATILKLFRAKRVLPDSGPSPGGPCVWDDSIQRFPYNRPDRPNPFRSLANFIERRIGGDWDDPNDHMYSL